MTLSIQSLSHVRKVGLIAAGASVALVAVAGIVMPPAVAVLLPMLALTAPFVVAGIVESSLEHEAAHA